MWKLFMILGIFNANVTYEEPIIVDGFQGKYASLAHGATSPQSTPKNGGYLEPALYTLTL